MNLPWTRRYSKQAISTSSLNRLPSYYPPDFAWLPAQSLGSSVRISGLSYGIQTVSPR